MCLHCYRDLACLQVWTVLYTMMGVASWQVWNAGGGWVPLTLYGVQLALNLAWSPIMFNKKDLGLALADISGSPDRSRRVPDIQAALQ